MQQKKLFTPFRIFSFIVLALMATAIIYAASISVLYWTGIGV